MNNKFQVLTNMYVCIRYFIGFTFLENVVLLVRYLPVIWWFWIHKSQYNWHFLVIARKLMFLKYSCQKNLELKYQGNLVIKFDDNVMKFIKVSIIGTCWFLLGNWCSQNTVVRKIWKKNCERPVFSEELAGCKKFFKGFPAI